MKLTFLPKRHFEVRTSVSCEEVLRRLGERVEPKRWFRFPFLEKHRPYEGVVSAEGFQINRVIQYRNSWLPFVEGSVRRDGGKTRIEVWLKLHPFVAVFTTVWLGFTGLGGLVAGVRLFTAQEPFEPMGLIPLGMFAFGYLLAHGAFAIEVGGVRQLLDQLARPDPG